MYTNRNCPEFPVREVLGKLLHFTPSLRNRGPLLLGMHAWESSIEYDMQPRTQGLISPLPAAKRP